MYYLPKFYPAVHKKLLGKRLNKVHTPYIIGHILPQFYFLVLFNGLEVCFCIVGEANVFHVFAAAEDL